MASSTILTSAWSHNCGMHVIADFLSEKLQQDDYKTVFTGQAYDALLKNFQEIMFLANDSELTVICDYFEINPVINHNYEPSKIKVA